MNVEEIIATVEARLRDGTGPARNVNGCVYATAPAADGTVKRCAVGALFTEEQARALQVAGIGGWNLEYRGTIERILGPDHWALDEDIESLLVDLQEIHDPSSHWVRNDDGTWSLSESGETRLQVVKDRWLNG